jgi:hypothetical protein
LSRRPREGAGRSTTRVEARRPSIAQPTGGRNAPSHRQGAPSL